MGTGGVQLKTIDPNAPKPAATPANHLDAIKQGIQLKKVDLNASKPQLAEQDDIRKKLAARGEAIAKSDSLESSENTNSDNP
jgi:hypothetical protein